MLSDISDVGVYIKKESKQSNLAQNDNKKILQVEMVSKMNVNDFSNLSLAEINFNGMSVENIIYIIENNKNGGNLDNNLSKNYIIELAKQNIELAKCLLINLKFNKDFIFLLNDVLKNDSVFEVPISFEVSEDLRIQIIECYLKVGNYAFVSKYMEMVLSNFLLESYRFEENKTILDKNLENNIKLTDNCYDYLLKNPVALITLVKYDSYLT